MDFHTSFRKLCVFRPSKAIDDKAYVDQFASDFIAAATSKLSTEARGTAKRGLMPWLLDYANRVSSPEEAEAWTSTDISTSDEDRRRYGEPVPGNGWEVNRESTMKRVNPRFVLRQWVLEETIAELERLGVAGIKEGRRILARILDVRTFPSQLLL